jgi:hypothetical protein
MEKRVTWFNGLEEADAADKAHYARMTPQQRLDEMG